MIFEINNINNYRNQNIQLSLRDLRTILFYFYDIKIIKIKSFHRDKIISHEIRSMSHIQHFLRVHKKWRFSLPKAKSPRGMNYFMHIYLYILAEPDKKLENHLVITHWLIGAFEYFEGQLSF